MSKSKDNHAMSVTTAALSAKALEKVVETLVSDLYKIAKDTLGNKVTQWTTHKRIKSIYTEMRHVRKVKTLWEPDKKEVDLFTFYYPSHVQLDGKRTPIGLIDDLGPFHGVVLQGIIGQGKSMLCRYLTIRESERGRAVPLFVELRRIAPTQTLLTYLLSELSVLGLEMNETVFSVLASHGKIVLFLDGFDELPEERWQGVISEIETMIRRWDLLRVIVTSRPDSGIDNSPLFRVVQLSPLQKEDYEPLINLVAHDAEVAQSLIAGIKRGALQIIELLTTPLMMTLLVFRYKIDMSIPENQIAFFDQLFLLLLQRHDKLKPGFARRRQSGLGDSVLEDVFNIICFLTVKEPKGVMTRRDLVGYAKQALKRLDHNGDPDKVIDDIEKVTCVILEEGDECRFIHSSVQEFHAACFVKEQPDSSAQVFYRGVVNHWKKWRQELEFLSGIDEYRFVKWFVIPELERILGDLALPAANDVLPSDAEVIRVFRCDLVEGSENGNSIMLRTELMIARLWSRLFSSDSWSMFGHTLMPYSKALYTYATTSEQDAKSDESHGKMENAVSLDEALSNDVIKPKVLHGVICSAQKELAKARRRVDEVESRKDLLQF